MRLAAFVTGTFLSPSIRLSGQTLGEIAPEVGDPSGGMLAGSAVLKAYFLKARNQ